MESRECCNKSIAQRSEYCDCYRPKCESADSRTRCARIHAPGCLKSRRRSEIKEKSEEREDEALIRETTSCYDKFALAKRLHAENLQHQPLPDRVDDRIFKNAAIAHGRCRPCSVICAAKCRDRANALAKEHPSEPALGCKKPETRMDLAICWETPVDRVYEPRRPTHIDGSEGGSAPAIFALIQHSQAPRNRELLSRGCQQQGDNVDCGCTEKKKDRETKSRSRSQCCCECLCDGMESVAVVGTQLLRDKKARSNSVPPLSPPLRITERRCVACKPEENAERKHRDPRLIRSAVGVTLDTEGKRDDILKNGLPSMRVSRPRTPFARRSFCIDTLAPPFSVVNGCRDADYPEHWRLMSVYQQSYRHPQRRRARYF